MLLVDSDNALGSPAGDVDDAFALAALLRSAFPIAAIASVGGNTQEPQADRNNRALGDVCGYRGRYLRGANAEKGERIDEAWDLWAGPAPLWIVALGPLTNVAAVLDAAERRGLPPAVSEVIMVGTNTTSKGRFPPYWPHEFNLTHDRRATRRVFASELPLTIIPLDVARRLRVGRSELAQLEGPLGDLLRRGSRRWLRRALLRRGSASFPVYDLVAALYAIDATGFDVEETGARLHRNFRIAFAVSFPRRVRLIRGFDRELLWRRFIDLVAAVEAQEPRAQSGGSTRGSGDALSERPAALPPSSRC